MNGIDKPVLGIIVGPTAVGKTALSIRLAKRLDAEIVSADSIQIYRGLDIGSAKPTDDEMDGVVHHMIDVRDPECTTFSVAEFQKQAKHSIQDIRSRKRYPLVVGGTGLYVNSLVYPLDFTKTAGNSERRNELQKKEEETPGCVYELLKQVDPISAQRLHKNDTRRVIRALELYYETGKPRQSYDFSNSAMLEIDCTPRIVALTMPRELLYERINKRVDMMMAAGFLDEVKAIMQRCADMDVPALQGLGYKQLIQHLHGEYTLEEAVDAIKKETRHFAKRQLTWFKRDARITWLDVTQFDPVELENRAYNVLKGT